MALGVIFGGTVDDYVSTDDVNLFDADTAHLQQGLGLWVGNAVSGGLQRVQVLTPVYGDWHGEAAASGSAKMDVTSGLGTNGVSVTVGETIGMATSIATDTSGAEYQIRYRFRDSGGGLISNIDLGFVAFPSINTFIQPTIATQVVPAGAATVWMGLQFAGAGATNPPAGAKMYWDASQISDDDSFPFVPSLDIQGTLGETITPVAMPVVYAADGTPLTVGRGWSGEGFRYTRYDGPVGVGPIVADFFPDDIPV